MHNETATDELVFWKTSEDKLRVRNFIHEYFKADYRVDDATYNLWSRGWIVTYISSKSAIAMCDWGKNELQFSKHFLKNGSLTWDELSDTILHEIAHAIDSFRRGYSDHSSKWKYVARAIGCNAKRCGNVDHSKLDWKWELICTECKKTLDRWNIKPDGYRMYHLHCKKSIPEIPHPQTKLIQNW